MGVSAVILSSCRATLIDSGVRSVASGNSTAYTVTPSGSHVTMSPDSPQTVNAGATQSFTLTPNTGYSISAAVAGSCFAGSWSGSVYTIGAVTADCTVAFSAIPNTYLVTPSGPNVSISPSNPQSVNYNGTQAFSVTANSGYTLSSTVGGTCPAGSWSGSTYTTGAVTADCSVSFGAALNGYTVTPSERTFRSARMPFRSSASTGQRLLRLPQIRVIRCPPPWVGAVLPEAGAGALTRLAP